MQFLLAAGHILPSPPQPNSSPVLVWDMQQTPENFLVSVMEIRHSKDRPVLSGLNPFFVPVLSCFWLHCAALLYVKRCVMGYQNISEVNSVFASVWRDLATLWGIKSLGCPWCINAACAIPYLDPGHHGGAGRCLSRSSVLSSIAGPGSTFSEQVGHWLSVRWERSQDHPSAPPWQCEMCAEPGKQWPWAGAACLGTFRVPGWRCPLTGGRGRSCGAARPSAGTQHGAGA